MDNKDNKKIMTKSGNITSAVLEEDDDGDDDCESVKSTSTVIESYEFIDGLLVDDENQQKNQQHQKEHQILDENEVVTANNTTEEVVSSSNNKISTVTAKGQKKRDKRAAKLKKEEEKESTYESLLLESAAARVAQMEARRKENDEYIADLRHKGLHNLSGEIDRCLKKVSEGVETFEDIWQKVHNATNTNQKEKYEADLKKEIKKLQRLRDQIKSWIASGEIKDKSTLVDTRKLIETQMERFKVVERETKTKAYSKEGLGAAQKLDPTTREREDLNNWLISSIDSFQLQIDQFECEVESILAAKKKKLDKDKQDRLDELKNSIERHRFHVVKLETLMRMLDNLAADVNALRTFLSQVKKIKDDIDYYLDSNQEPEFEENEFIYDDIDGLEDFDDGLTGQPAGAGLGEDGLLTEESPISVITSGNTSPISPLHSSDTSDPERRRKSMDDSTVNKVVRPVAIKAIQSNHSPISIGGGVGVVKVGGTPNNSSPSSGLSNHVSSLSSLSSSPTHNFHNALNNSKSIAHTDSSEHNNGSTTDTLCYGTLSSSPVMNSTSILDSFEVIPTVNGGLENGRSSPIDDYTHNTHQLSSSAPSSSSVIGSSSGGIKLENGLHSPPLQQLSSSTTEESSRSHNLNSLSSTTENERSQQQQQFQHHQLFGDSSSLESTTSQQTSSSNSSSFLHQTFKGLAASISGVSNNFSNEGFPSSTNLGVSSNSSSLISNATSNSSGSNNSNSVLGSNVIIGGIVGIQQQQSSAGGEVVSSSSVSPVVTNSTTTPSSMEICGGSPFIASSTTATSINNNSNNSLSASTSAVSSHNNSSSSGILSQRDIQQLQHIQQHSQPSGNNMESTPISEYLRLQSQDQILLNRILNESESMASLKSMAQDVLDRSGLSLGDHSKNLLLENKTKEAHIPPLLGVAPLGPVPLQKEHQHQFQMMDAAHCHLPVSADSERMRQFLPRNPYPTPHYYPQHPLSNSDTFEFFNRLSIETLFFIFYYLEGTKAQYLAAKVLKKQSWRFHTKYMMWFQRHEEPKVINDEYEQGTYVYFDIEKWGQRKKDGFVFEYRYLEDRDLG